MGASAYIGRVGRLAVALGVGTAIVTGHGIASADGVDTTSSTSSTSDTAPGAASASETDSTPGAGVNPSSPPSATTSTPSSTKPSDATEPTDPEGTTHTPSQTASGPVPSGVVNAQTNTGKSGSTQPTETTPPTKPAKPDPVTEPVTKTATKKKTPSHTIDEDKAAQSTKKGSAQAVAAASEQQPTTAKKESAPPAATAPAATAPAATAPAATAPAASAEKSVTTFALSSATVQPTAQPAPVAPPNPLKIVSNLVTSVVGMVLGPIAGNSPATPAEPPMAWALLAFARREFDGFVSAVTGGSTEAPAAAVQTTSASVETARVALAAATVNTVAALPVANPQLSPSTSIVQWVTGDYQVTNKPFIADTLTRFGVSGTDVGTMWDNGMVDDPTTPFDEHQVLMAFGDTFGDRSVPGEDWRFNVLMRSADHVLGDGMDVPDGEFGNGNWYGGMPLWDVPPGRDYEDYARRIINPEDLPAGAKAGITLIPTAGISVPTPSTKYGVTQYVSFMSVTNWGSPGQWTTNFSAIAYSEDNGENWEVAPTSVRYNQPMSGNQNFQQAAFVRPGDGYVYAYGTPNGRQGSAYLSRVAEKDILDVTKYEYYSKGSAGGWFGIGATPAGWKKNNPSAATPVFGEDRGACGVGNPGNQVSELSVQYNKQLKKYVVLYGDQFNNIVMRTSDTPQGTWSGAKVLIPQQPGGIYAPMMHPWSPSTMGTGNDLYWNLSWWSDYNVTLMKTDLTKV